LGFEPLALKKVFLEMVFENYGFKLNNTVTNLVDNAHLIHPLDKDKTYASMNMAILGTGDLWQYEYRHLKFDNTFAIVKTQLISFVTKQEKPLGLLAR
jgi:hypothetical protein